MFIQYGIAIFSQVVRNKDTLKICIIWRTKGIIILADREPIHVLFAIVSSKHQKYFYLHSIMCFVKIEEHIDFKKEW